MNGQHIKVLVVEHDPVHAGLLQDMLRPVSQFDLSAAGRLDEALRQLGAGAFDIMLLDLRLPDRLGLAAYRDLRHLLPALPIVVLTGPAEEILAQQAVREGAQDYLVKDQLNPQLLGRAIRHAIERERSDAALMEAERKYRGIFEHIVEGIFQNLENDLAEIQRRVKVSGPLTAPSGGNVLEPSDERTKLSEYAEHGSQRPGNV